MKKLVKNHWKSVLALVAVMLSCTIGTEIFAESFDGLSNFLMSNCLTNDTVDGFVPSVGLAGAAAAVLKTPDDKDFEVKDEDALKEMKDEAIKAYYNDLINAQTYTIGLLQKQVKDNKEKDNKEVEKQIAELTKANNEVLTQTLKAQGKQMAKLQKEMEKGLGAKTAMEKNVLYKALNDRKEEISTAMEKKTALKIDIPNFSSKASQTSTDITNRDDIATFEPGVGQLATRAPFMRQLFPSVNLDSEYLKYVDQTSKVRDAKNVALCGTTTHNSKIEWQIFTLQMQKVRDFVDVCLDMMEDYTFIEGEIRSLVDMDVQLKVDEGLLLGDGNSPNLTGVDSVAAAFAAGDYAGTVQDPTLADLIVVCQSLISDAGQNNKFQANVAIVNPVDATTMRLEKDADGNYLLPNFISQGGRSVGGITVIENQLVPAGQMYVMDTRMGRIYQRRGVTVELAFENKDNFESEIVTVKAYERLNLRIRNVDANAFLHVSDIPAALTAITEA